MLYRREGERVRPWEGATPRPPSEGAASGSLERGVGGGERRKLKESFFLLVVSGWGALPAGECGREEGWRSGGGEASSKKNLFSFK